MTWHATKADLDDAATLAIAAAPCILPGLGRRPRILLIGEGRHGKDTAAALIAARYGLRFASSSEFAAQRAVYPLVSDLYPDWQAAYADRHAHRDLWFHAIRAYNLRPGPMLCDQIFEDHEIYVGMRSRAEFERARPRLDLVVWVDAARRLPPEGAGSMELTSADADIVIDNNGDPANLAAWVAAIPSLVAALGPERVGNGIAAPCTDFAPVRGAAIEGQTENV